MIWIAALCLLVIGASYFVTKYIGGAQLKKRKNGNFELLDACPLGNHKHLQLFKAGGRYFVAAVCKDTVILITELSEDEIVKNPSASGIGSFPDIFSKIAEKKNGGFKSGKSGTKAENDIENDTENNSKG